MLKGKKPWIAFLNLAPTRGLVQVDPAMGTKAAAFSPAKGLKRQAQQHILAQKPGHVEAIVLHHIDIHLGSAEFALLCAKSFTGSRKQNRELIRDRNRDRLRASATQYDCRCCECSARKNAVDLPLQMK